MTDDKWHDFTVTNQSPTSYKAEVQVDGQMLKGSRPSR